LRIPPGWQVDNYPFFTRGYLRVGMDGSNTSRRHRVPVFSSREHSQLVIMIAWIGRNDGNLGSGRIEDWCSRSEGHQRCFSPLPIRLAGLQVESTHPAGDSIQKFGKDGKKVLRVLFKGGLEALFRRIPLPIPFQVVFKSKVKRKSIILSCSGT
jgi:hypothetical protein